MATERHHDLDDAAGRKQASEGVGCRAGESGAVAVVDRGRWRVGVAADERRFVGGLWPQSLEVE